MIPELILLGALSMYHPGDGWNAGELACGGQMDWDSEHIAIRAWRGRCGARAWVCAGRHCAFATVRDSGPWGAVCRGSWRVWARPRLSIGCRRRAVVDLSHALWVRLGKPRTLSPVVVVVFPREKHNDSEI